MMLAVVCRDFRRVLSSRLGLVVRVGLIHLKGEASGARFPLVCAGTLVSK